MSRQDKATTDRNAKILRSLTKQDSNAKCADCKRHDARWASWNLGLFVCISCSGIHRSMGTHISKVKSIDLDIWQPEQMEMMQKWGNRLANLYWEKHLKPGHIPPEHKMESFIRSKYESKRWAMSGPVPSDPRTLEEDASAAPEPAAAPAPSASAPPPSYSRSSQAQPSFKAPPTTSASSRSPHPLLSTSIPLRSAAVPPPSLISTTPSPAPASAPAPAPVAAAPSSSLFDLDFHAPPVAPTAALQSSRQADKKNDIMSLFSSPPPPAPAPQPWAGSSSASYGSGAGLVSGFGGMSMGGAGANVWGEPATTTHAPTGGYSQHQQQQQQQAASRSPPAAAASSIWDTPGSNVWAAAPSQAAAPAKDDAFADIWK